MLPNKDDFLDCRALWRGEHQGISYELSWHGRSDYSPQGTWCYYLFVTSQQFYPEDWERLRLKVEDKQFSELGIWRRHWSYDDFPDLDAHSGWTFGEMSIYLGQDGAQYELVKIGCDYAHLWDHEGNFPHGRREIEHDAKHSIDLLCKMFPRRRERCSYSGQYDDSSQFYTAVNGRRIHKSQQTKLPEKWAAWQPATLTALERNDVENKGDSQL